MISIAFIFIFLCLFQSLLFASEERDLTFSEFSKTSAVTDTEMSLSSIELEEKEFLDTPYLEKTTEKHNYPEMFLSDLKYKRWEYARRQLLQGLVVHTEYPPYELLLKTTRPEYYEPSIDEAYQHGWILDTSEEAWEREQLEKQESALPAISSILANIEEVIDPDPKIQENLDKEKFQGWQEVRDLENVQILMVLNYILSQKTSSFNQTKGFIKDTLKTRRLPREREGMLRLWSERNLDEIMGKMWSFVLEDEEDYSHYVGDVLIQEIQNRVFEQDTDFQIQATLNELKQDQQLQSVVFMRQQRRIERLRGISSGAKTLTIHEPDNKEAVCSFLWDGTDARVLFSLLEKKSTPLPRRKTKDASLRVNFDDMTARSDYHKKDPTNFMDFQGFFVLSQKERTYVPKTRTKAMASIEINSAWKTEAPCIQIGQRGLLKKSPSMSFSTIFTYPESCGAYGNGSGV